LFTVRESCFPTTLALSRDHRNSDRRWQDVVKKVGDGGNGNEGPRDRLCNLKCAYSYCSITGQLETVFFLCVRPSVQRHAAALAACETTPRWAHQTRFEHATSHNGHPSGFGNDEHPVASRSCVSLRGHPGLLFLLQVIFDMVPSLIVPINDVAELDRKYPSWILRLEPFAQQVIYISCRGLDHMKL
jgi:hypothetical protein